MSAAKNLSRRAFLNQSAVGITGAAFSPALLELLLLASGCKSRRPGPTALNVILPDEVLNRAVTLLMAKGADFADVFAERAAADSVRSDDRKIKTTTLVEKGVGLRAVKDGRTFYAYTDSFEPDRIYETARYVADAAAAPVSASTPPAILLKPLTSPLSFPIRPLPSEIAIADKIETFRSLTDRAWSADARVVQVQELMRETLRQVNIATSSGSVVRQTLGLTEFIARIHVKGSDGCLQAAQAHRGAYAGRSFFTGENGFEKIVDTAVAKALKLLEAVDAPRGTFPVVLAAGDNGVLFHESCGHGMEADLVYKGSNYKNQLGKPTAARSVTLIDDGTLEFMPGSFAFDDEGTPSQRTVLIEDGVQRSYLCDRIWGGKLGLESTGSGRRESFRYPPIPRMRNTFIAAGSIPPDDIIAATKRGLYIVDVGGGGQVDVITGNFMMGVGEAYLIENGKITRPVKGATISGMGIETMKSIDMVGNDLVLFPSAGRCGKMQSVPVGVGMPTIRVRNILVGGSGPAWTDIEKG